MAIALAEFQRPLDIQDYLDAPDDGVRYEIINGEMIEVPSPSPNTMSSYWRSMMRSRAS